MTRRAWIWWLALTVPAAVLYPLLEYGTWPASVLFDGLGLLAVAVMVVAIRRRRPARPRMWYLLLGGTAASALGDTLYDFLDNVAHVDPYPSGADVLYVLSYPLTVAGLTMLIRGRARGRDRAGLIDGAIISTALALPAWTFLVRPISALEHAGSIDRMLSLGYPVLDVLLIVLTARLVTTPGARRLPIAYQLLVIAQFTRLLPDLSYSVSTIADVEFPWLDSGWLLTYVLTTAAALHPEMARIAEPGPRRDVTISAPRLTLLTLASLLAPACLAVQGLTDPARIDWTAVAAGSAVLFLLVVARMKMLLVRVHRQARQLDELAHLDGLTGVPNRRSWDEALTRELAVARRSGGPVVVGLVDLDHFKRFNDTYGHQAGDLMLKEAAAAWRAALRDADRLARYGGEEFGILITGLPGEEAHDIVDRLRAVTPGGQTFSAGLAEWTGTETADELSRRADKALYQAKEAGRDRVVLAREVTLTK